MSIDLFDGNAGSALIVRNVDRWRLVGLPPDDSVTVATSYPRPRRFPGKQDVRALSEGCTPEHQRDLLFEDFAVHWGGAASDTSA